MFERLKRWHERIWQAPGAVLFRGEDGICGLNCRAGKSDDESSDHVVPDIGQVQGSVVLFDHHDGTVYLLTRDSKPGQIYPYLNESNDRPQDMVALLCLEEWSFPADEQTLIDQVMLSLTSGTPRLVLVWHECIGDECMLIQHLIYMHESLLPRVTKALIPVDSSVADPKARSFKNTVIRPDQFVPNILKPFVP